MNLLHRCRNCCRNTTTATTAMGGTARRVARRSRAARRSALALVSSSQLRRERTDAGRHHVARRRVYGSELPEAQLRHVMHDRRGDSSSVGGGDLFVVSLSRRLASLVRFFFFTRMSSSAWFARAVLLLLFVRSPSRVVLLVARASLGAECFPFLPRAGGAVLDRTRRSLRTRASRRRTTAPRRGARTPRASLRGLSPTPPTTRRPRGGAPSGSWPRRAVRSLSGAAEPTTSRGRPPAAKRRALCGGAG